MYYSNLILPNDLREQLKKPFGRLVSDLDEVKDCLKNSGYVVAVGDKVAENLLEKGVEPNIVIYDSRTRRQEIETPEKIKKYRVKELKIDNPAGGITIEAFKAVEFAIKSRENIKIKVEGEEDLLTLPAIMLAPLNSVVLYGQPDEGVVLVEVNKENKKKAEEIIKQMKVSK